MAKYLAKVELTYGLEIEVNAAKGDDFGAMAEANDVIDNQLPDLAGNYSGNKVEVSFLNKEIFAFFDKSDATKEKEKKDKIDLYLATLDDEEKALLIEKLNGE
jgi:hypothetical protein